MNSIIDRVPAHIWAGLAVLLFGLGLSLLMRGVELPRIEREETGCTAQRIDGVLEVTCVDDLPVPERGLTSFPV